MVQVKTFWQWADFLTQQCETKAKTPCYVNLDETSVPRSAGKAAGFVAPKRLWPGRAAPRRPVQKQHKRAAVTYISLITNLPHMQPKLPQIFLCNERIIPAWALDRPDLEKPGTVSFWRGKSGWNNVAKMLLVLQKLRDAFAENEDLQPILILDCVGCHIHPAVVAKAQDLHVWLLVVPARLTFLLQPLDVYAFAPFKACLTKLLLEAEDEGGKLEVIQWMNCLCSTIRKFWCSRKWKAAFLCTGVVPGGPLTQDLHHLAVVRALSPSSPLEPPDVEAVQAIFPRRCYVPYVSLFWLPADLDPPLVT